MERVRSNVASLFVWSLVAGMLSQNLVIPVMSSTVEDQKNYYPPDPHSGSPPSGSHSTPSHPPSHGGGGSYNPTPSPPTNCGSPPHHHTPTPSHHDPPTTPSTPSGGGYYHSPPVIVSPPTYVSPPTTPVSPPIPIIGTPPIEPGTPDIPTPPFLPDPNSPPFTCIYWRSHPTVIWGLLGWWGTLGHTFGVTSLPGLGSGSSTMSLPDALSNTRTDGLGELYRQGTAALLNAMVDDRFHFTTKQVRDSFLGALGSNKVAATQARVFKLANEGKLKPRT